MRYLLIGGENTRKLITKYLSQKEHFLYIDIRKLLDESTSSVPFDSIIWYGAKIHKNIHTEVKSLELIDFQRKLFNSLQKQHITINTVGKIQQQITIGKNDEEVLVFKEKGVDVQIAVDITALSYTDTNAEIYLFSSDSDLVPAVKHARKNNSSVFYICTEEYITKALAYSANAMRVVRATDIQKALQIKLKDATSTHKI
jgi:uncharacterized LabA/DUF88 family protein